MWGLLLRPLVPAVVLMFTFGSIRPVETGGTVPYAVFFLSGYLPWRLFQASLRYVPRSLTWSQSLMRRTYFPRLLVPLAGFGMTFIEAGILAGVLAAVTIMTVSRGEPFPLHLGWHTLWLVPCVVGGPALRPGVRARVQRGRPVLSRRHLLAALLRPGHDVRQRRCSTP